jgi:hypothetical protein
MLFYVLYLGTAMFIIIIIIIIIIIFSRHNSGMNTHHAFPCTMYFGTLLRSSGT